MADQNESEPELAEVLVTIDPVQARMARDLLETSGIETFMFDSESSRMFGTTAAVTIRLMVHADAKSEAIDRLKELGFSS